LRLDEFAVGDLGRHEDDRLTLLLPRSGYEQTSLMGEVGDQRYGIVLDGELQGQAFLHKPENPWEGVLVPGVEIEVDEKTAFDPRAGVELGALVREETSLAIAAAAGHSFRTGMVMKVVLVKNLPALPAREGVAFRKWRIVIGQGVDKRELLAVSSEAIAKARAAAKAT